MMASVNILLGVAIGWAGFMIMGSSPLAGGGGLLLSGFFILSGIDQLYRAKVKAD